MPVTKYYPFTSATTAPSFIPATEQSAVLPSGTQNFNPTERWAELSTAKAATAVAMVSGAFNSLNISTAQSAKMGMGYYQLGSGTVAAGTWRIAVNSAVQANNAANAFLAASIYVWRPSNSSVVGRVYDSATALGTEFATTAATRLVSLTGTAVACQNGDYLVVELWHVATQGGATAYSITVLLDNQTGRTDVTANAASPTGQGGFIESPDTLPVFIPPATGSGTAPLAIEANAEGQAVATGTGQPVLVISGTGTDRFASTLTPDATVTNANWTAVGAATVHAALATGDADYIQASQAGATTRITLSNPARAYSSIAAATLRIRAKGP